MTDKPLAIVIDLDSTLANNDHRQKYLIDAYKGKTTIKSSAEREVWKKFNAGIPKDTVNKWCERIIKSFPIIHSVIFLTGRGEDVRKITRQWLNIHKIPYDLMIMRNYNEFGMPSVDYKRINMKKIQESYIVELAIDDELPVCEMYRSMGIPTLNVVTLKPVN